MADGFADLISYEELSNPPFNFPLHTSLRISFRVRNVLLYCDITGYSYLILGSLDYLFFVVIPSCIYFQGTSMNDMKEVEA
jgi:hypothetical protein